MATSPKLGRWQFWIDRGGTFTDIVAYQPDGLLKVHKLLSENPDRYADASIQGIRELMGLTANQSIPVEKIEAIKMGTTVATNALLERQGDRTVLTITKGFRDALRIGYQNRPQIFARHIVLPEMLYERVVEVEERYSARGEELTPVNLEQVQAELQSAYEVGIRSCAIVLMHGYRYPDHEQQVAAIAEKIGFTQISTSHQVSPLMKLVSRGDTTVVDAYLSPILRRYVEQVSQQLSRDSETALPQLMFMQSNGGLAHANQFQGKDSILSGPAGGMVGAVQTSHKAGLNQIITFDMGGTSTDVAHYNGEYERAFETEVAGVRLRTPIMAIHTVAAGGGSILTFDGARYRVGPASAGANPGPACYRKQGPLTVTDCNVMLGKIQPDFFPPVFGPEGNLPLDADVVNRKFSDLARQVEAATGEARSPEQVAQGFLAIAVEKMASAIKKISVQRGYDITEYTLCCFGGAGGQHACQIAESLGIRQIFLHPYAGVLSAYGMGLADQRVLRERSVEAQLLADLLPVLDQGLQELATQAEAALLEQDPTCADRLETLCRVHLKYEGTDSFLIVNYGSLADLIQQFEQAHYQRYGFIAPHKPLIVEAIAVEAIGHSATPDVSIVSPSRPGPLAPTTHVPVFTGDRWQDTPVFLRDQLQPNDRLTGPALIMEATSTIVVEPGWEGSVTGQGDIVLEKAGVRRQESEAELSWVTGHGALEEPGDRSQETEAERSWVTGHWSLMQGVETSTNPITGDQEQLVPQMTNDKGQTTSIADPVLLEIFNHLLMAIAEQMGFTLQNTAYSVNIKERLDFSCAIFDQQGQLVANAPHIPVHLGSMGESVDSLLRQQGERLQPGDVYVSNNPYNGGTHLPDITVITPVFAEAGNTQKPLFFVASRGHHADIGGITPGSMPPGSTHIQQEGILIDNLQLVSEGQFREAELLDLLTSGPYPVRNPAQNLADLKAQIAANEKGVQELHKMVAHFGLDTVQAYMQHVQDNAEASVKRVIEVLKDGQFTYEMDDGCQIQVTVSIDRTHRRAAIDFTGTSPQQPTNINAPLAVCKAAVLYVFRTLVEDDIPLNAGCLKPLDITVPEGCLLNPRYPAAVVAGNVETSQVVTDALYGALGVMAASQGTMNNFTFGNDRYQYYETICGGSGAGPTFDGTDAVQTHMTNSRLTDPEVLEWRFPVLLDTFEIRPNSGGHGQHSGGNGVIRSIQFREPMTAAILSGHRHIPPFGLEGGQPAALGKNRVERADGSVEELAGNAEVTMQPGDRFVIETPGGGGYGANA